MTIIGRTTIATITAAIVFGAGPAWAQTTFVHVQPHVRPAGRVELVITTNAPTPIKVATGIALRGLRDDDPFIGVEGPQVTLRGPTTRITLDTHKADRPLPKATFNATVDYYPRWGAAGNPRAAHLAEMHARAPFRLAGPGISGNGAIANERDRSWAMEHNDANAPWRPAANRRLGSPLVGRSSAHPGVVIYYYPRVNLSFLVNPRSRLLLTWKDGNSLRQ